MKYRLIKPLLFTLPPETAHRIAVAALRIRLVSAAAKPLDASLRVSAFGLSFPSPVGIAAGFDKNAEAVDALLDQGFGFVEAGTVTPRPQAGNPRPRMFRLVKDEGIINRLGFNSSGKEVFVRNLTAAKHRGIIGANIGKNRESADAASDYAELFKAVSPYADYVAVNISSPNTEGLRSLQEKENLSVLLTTLTEARGTLPRQPPLLVKIAPDLSAAQREAIAEAALFHRIDGLIIGNTTVSRPDFLRSARREEKGGLSGRPLFTLSMEVLRDMYRLTQGALPLIGVGGISSAEDAYAKIRAGATLVELYTGLVYRGFGLLREIHDGLPRLLERDGFKNVAEAVGADHRIMRKRYSE